jgi:PAS domain S-box-containing protein
MDLGMRLGWRRWDAGRVRVWGDTLERLSAPAVLAIILALLLCIFGLRLSDASRNDEILLLFVVPVMLAAVRFGARGGMVAATLACALTFAWDEWRVDLDLGALGYLSRGLVFFGVGAVLGRFMSSRTALVQRIARSEEMSPDMIATAGQDGYFRSLNPAWQRTLGYTSQQLLGRPFLELVHPDDRDETDRQAAALPVNGEVVGFRNRQRAVDGSYRWFEWNASWSREDSLIYAVARDVTVQREAEEFVRDQARKLEQAVRERTSALQEARLENLTRLALAAEYRDDDTHQHTQRVGRNAQLIAQSLGCDEHFVWAIELAAPLHDVGKIGIPDHILLKPGKLTDEEFELMKTHTTIGAAILGGSRSELLRMGEEIALSHHERWDGSGYPHGVAGESIPLTGRIVAVADAFDAMTNARPYKKAMPVQAALDELARCSGSHFDPDVVQAFRWALGHDLSPVAS